MHHCSSLLTTMLFYRGKVCNNLKSVLDKLFTESDLLQEQSKSFSQTGLFLKQVKHVKSVIVHIVQPWPQRPSYVEHSTYNVLPRINDFQNKFDARLAQIYTLTDCTKCGNMLFSRILLYNRPVTLRQILISFLFPCFLVQRKSVKRYFGRAETQKV